MRIESSLSHLSENKAVVRVQGWINEKCVGSALAEGATVEIAEDNAIFRLNQRLKIIDDKKVNINLNNKSDNIKQENFEIPINNENSDYTELINEPDDWSNELIEIDLQIKRLKWTRDDEIGLLQDLFGYNNRNKITKYKELLNYLNTLKKLPIDTTELVNKSNIDNLIHQSDILLRELSWDHKKGREYLQKEFNVTTRKELDEIQLIGFINKLKSIQNDN